MYTNSQQMMQQKIAELLNSGFDVYPVTMTNQGGNLSEKMEENKLFETWIKEKENAGYEKEGIPYIIGENTKTQLMKKTAEKKVVTEI